jgi:hypothetical protein
MLLATGGSIRLLAQNKMKGLLWKTEKFAFLDLGHFGDLSLDHLATDVVGIDLNSRFTSDQAILRSPDGSVFNWFIKRLNFLSAGRLVLDPEGGDEGCYEFEILAVKGTEPCAVIEIQGSNYSVTASGRTVSPENYSEAIEALVESFLAEPDRIRNHEWLYEEEGD